MATYKTKLVNQAAIFAHLVLHVRQVFKKLVLSTKFVFQLKLKLILMLNLVQADFIFHLHSQESAATALAYLALLPSSAKQVELSTLVHLVMFVLKSQMPTNQILRKRHIHVLSATTVVRELWIQFYAQSAPLQMTQQPNKQVSVQCVNLVSSAILTA